ncbi:cytochrome P450 4C1-like isoform X1 [Leptidea sinapis]|uniref:cytochrome P450 4C1-like isoform X1 n=2 Tax=Leptidea sinapis TaxID=189913 RepID=UPI0021247E8E|nr:cytochrome P450 4C1-like isoform X1 [Leptidea sinapis]
MFFWLLILLVTILFYWFTRIYINPGNFPNFPGKLPVIGHLHKLPGSTKELWDLVRQIADAGLKTGNVILFYFGFFPVYVITDPDDCYKVAIETLHKPGIMKRYSRDMLGNGLLVGPVSVWKKHRKLINPSFNQQVLDGFMNHFNDQSRILVKELENAVGNTPKDHRSALERKALRTICGTAIGVHITGNEIYSKQVLESFKETLLLITIRFTRFHYYFNWIYKRTKLWKDTEQLIKFSHDFTERMLQTKKNEIANTPRDKDKYLDSLYKPFIYHLLENENKKLSLEDIRDEIKVMIMTGYETSNTVILFVLLLVGTYPHVQQKIFEELEEVFEDSDRDVTKADLSKLVYIDAVLKETSRYCPAVPVIGRVLHEDVQLKNSVLKKGNVGIIMLYAAMRHPMWGPDADQWIPERWLDPQRLPANPHAFAAFSYGKRNCIGQTYAVMSMKTTLVHLFRRYKVSSNFANVKLKLDAVLRPHSGYEFSIQYRNK